MTVPPPFTHDHYRALLHEGLANGYRFCSFSEISLLRSGDAKACFLRHDCDNDLTAALDLARIEADIGVRSTYFIMLRSALYNSLAPTGSKLIRQILSYGHELGLHFDESVFASADAIELCRRVDEEREILKREFCKSIDVVSFHQPGPRVLANDIKIRCLNTYDRSDMAGVYYTSDSNLQFRGGDPRDLFKIGEHRLIQILLHPEWWTESEMPLQAKWAKMLSNNFETVQDSLAAREAAYSVPLKLVVTPRDETE